MIVSSRWLGVLIGGVWVFHGLWSKVLGQIPRHRLIVGRILGDAWAGHATLAIGVCEILLGIWVFTGLLRRTCAAVQTIALVTMNTLEIAIARDLLLSAPEWSRSICSSSPLWGDGHSRRRAASARAIQENHGLARAGKRAARLFSATAS